MDTPATVPFIVAQPRPQLWPWAGMGLTCDAGSCAHAATLQQLTHPWAGTGLAGDAVSWARASTTRGSVSMLDSASEAASAAAAR